MPSKRRRLSEMKTPAVQHAPNVTAAAAAPIEMPAAPKATVPPNLPIATPKPSRFAPMKQFARAWLLKKTWPLRRRWWMLLCAMGKHELEHTISLGPDGEPTRDERGNTKPSDLQRCVRPDCRIFVGVPKLLAVGKWMQTDDFMVLARTDCVYCHGRGYGRRMVLDPSTKAKMPCTCLRVQPVFVEHIESKAAKR